MFKDNIILGTCALSRLPHIKGYKRKNNCGRVLYQQWIFGGICRETKEVFLVEVPDRFSATFMSKIHHT